MSRSLKATHVRYTDE